MATVDKIKQMAMGMGFKIRYPMSLKCPSCKYTLDCIMIDSEDNFIDYFPCCGHTEGTMKGKEFKQAVFYIQLVLHDT